MLFLLLCVPLAPWVLGGATGAGYTYSSTRDVWQPSSGRVSCERVCVCVSLKRVVVFSVSRPPISRPPNTALPFGVCPSPRARLCFAFTYLLFESLSRVQCERVLKSSCLSLSSAVVIDLNTSENTSTQGAPNT